MTVLLILIPAALFLGLLGLVAFMWALRSRQFEDLDGAAHRVLFDDDPPRPEQGKEGRAPLDPGQVRAPSGVRK
jgi:cbb3-type cytochrome oxidase maturation protein